MLYFVPGVKSIKHAIAACPFIAEMCSNAQSRETMRGPSETPGLLIADGRLDSAAMRFDEQTQVWSRRFGSDAWIGRETAAVMSSTYFAKPEQMAGQSIILLDGNAWHIPRLMAYDAEQTDGQLVYRNLCDRVLSQDAETGRMVPGDVTPPYREIWKMAVEIGDDLLKQFTGGSTSATMEDDTLENFVAALLGLNYRVGKPEISALGLLSSSLAREVIRIGLDWSTLETNIKNRLSRQASGGMNTESGATPPTEASTIATDPQSPS
jgi:hypothetical protein